MGNTNILIKRNKYLTKLFTEIIDERQSLPIQAVHIWNHIIYGMLLTY